MFYMIGINQELYKYILEERQRTLSKNKNFLNILNKYIFLITFRLSDINESVTANFVNGAETCNFLTSFFFNFYIFNIFFFLKLANWNYVEIQTKESTENYAINIKYVSNGVDVITNVFVNYDGTEPAASGDPHFSQFVQDELTNKRKLICYDVTGESGQSIHILSINNEYKIYGKLLDDYYMHSIHIFSKHKQLFNFSVNHLFHKNQFLGSWHSELKKKMTFKDFVLIVKENLVVLKHSNGDAFQIKITKNENIFGKNYLDISFDLEMLNKENLGGLIGDIGKNHYKFIQSIQDNNNKKFILVNGILKTAELRNRKSVNCLLFDTKDLIEENSYNNYVY